MISRKSPGQQDFHEPRSRLDAESQLPAQARQAPTALVENLQRIEAGRDRVPPR